MDRKIAILLITPIVLLMIVILYFNNYKYNKSEKSDTDTRYLVPINTVSPLESDDRDLFFLDSILKNKEIVLLGEQQHGDGSTFEAKSRLIKYLHQKLNYNVLIFEANELDCYILWDSIYNQQANIKIYRNHLYDFWTEAEQMKFLFKYIDKNVITESPLIIAGCDLQIRNDCFPIISNVIDKYIIESNVKIEELSKVYLRTCTFIANGEEYKLDENTKKDFVKLTKEYADKLINRMNDSASVLDYLVQRYLNQLSLYYYHKFFDDMGSSDAHMIRDSIMANNIIWFKINMFKNKKIIVWAANSHVIRNASLINSKEETTTYKRMGEYLFEKLDSLVYSICMTSYQGVTFNIYTHRLEKVNECIDGGLEYKIHLSGLDFCFIDLSKNNSKEFLNNEYSKILGHHNLETKLKFNTDAIFYIDKMKPLIIEKNGQ